MTGKITHQSLVWSVKFWVLNSLDFGTAFCLHSAHHSTGITILSKAHPPQKKKKNQKKSRIIQNISTKKLKLKSLIQLSQQNFKWYKGAKTDDPYNTTVGLIIFTRDFSSLHYNRRSVVA